MSFFHGSFEKARGLDRHHGVINYLLFCVGRLCDECYDIALLKPFEELFDEVLGIPSRGPESLIGYFFAGVGRSYLAARPSNIVCGESLALKLMLPILVGSGLRLKRLGMALLRLGLTARRTFVLDS